jgi:PAS domain S-box-containing protein
VFWVLLAAQFLVYPHLAYLRARTARDSKRTEETNLYIDALLLGAWIAALGFPTWLLYAALFSTTLNAMVLGGVYGVLWSAGCFGVGAAIFSGLGGLRHEPETSHAVSLLCFLGSLGYTSAIGHVVFAQSRRLAAAFDALRTSRARYRLMAENAADLIGLVDHFGRWLYFSPSYEAVLGKADLAPGVDAFRRLHPDDADLARSTVLRATDGRARELALRLVDRDGRIRRYETRIQPLGERPAQRVLLVSRDVTDLRESEERVLVAAHAIEGMTEAIVITAADGTIVSVNRAFSQITGWQRDEVLGKPEKAIRNALQPAGFYDELYAAVLRDGHWSGSGWARRKDGAVYKESRSVRAARDGEGRITHYVIVFYQAQP